jgi:hypothetical protein
MSASTTARAQRLSDGTYDGEGNVAATVNCRSYNYGFDYAANSKTSYDGVSGFLKGITRILCPTDDLHVEDCSSAGGGFSASMSFDLLYSGKEFVLPSNTFVYALVMDYVTNFTRPPSFSVPQAQFSSILILDLLNTSEFDAYSSIIYDFNKYDGNVYPSGVTAIRDDTSGVGCVDADCIDGVNVGIGTFPTTLEPANPGWQPVFHVQGHGPLAISDGSVIRLTLFMSASGLADREGDFVGINAINSGYLKYNMVDGLIIDSSLFGRPLEWSGQPSTPIEPAVVPLPGSLWMYLIALLGLTFPSRRRPGSA